MGENRGKLCPARPAHGWHAKVLSLRKNTGEFSQDVSLWTPCPQRGLGSGTGLKTTRGSSPSPSPSPSPSRPPPLPRPLPLPSSPPSSSPPSPPSPSPFFAPFLVLSLSPSPSPSTHPLSSPFCFFHYPPRPCPSLYPLLSPSRHLFHSLSVGLSRSRPRPRAEGGHGHGTEPHGPCVRVLQDRFAVRPGGTAHSAMAVPDRAVGTAGSKAFCAARGHHGLERRPAGDLRCWLPCPCLVLAWHALPCRALSCLRYPSSAPVGVWEHVLVPHNWSTWALGPWVWGWG